MIDLKGFDSIYYNPDQESVRKDLQVYFGPRSDKYIKIYEDMKVAKSGGPRLTRSWSWPAFIFSFVWFFYRKMYIWGGAAFLISVVLGFVVGGSAGTVSSVIYAGQAKNIYMASALSRLLKADGLGLEGQQRHDYLRRAGGVSWVGGGLAGLVYGASLLLVLAQTLLKKHSG